jgi:hypothetical protein
MTGTLYTPNLISNNFSGVSLTIDYIIFNTGTTSAATVAGTVYFDNKEKLYRIIHLLKKCYSKFRSTEFY